MKKLQSGKKKRIGICINLICAIILSLLSPLTIKAASDESDVYYVSTAEDLVNIAKEVNAGKTFENETICLNADIDLEGVNWIPIGNSSHPFKGSMKAVGAEKRVISNLSVQSVEYGGFIGYLDATTTSDISNIMLENVNVSATYAGGLAGYVRCTSKLNIKNCSVSGSVEGKGCTGTGGLVGTLRTIKSSETNILQCKNDSNVYSFGDGSCSGGLIGICWGTSDNSGAVNMEMCCNLGKVSAEATYSYCTTAAGGLIGDLRTDIIKIEQCFNEGTIYSKAYYDYVGGFIGTMNRNLTTDFLMTDSYVNATIKGICTNGYSQGGGFIGHLTGDNFIRAEIIRCYAAGNLDVRNKAGFICWQENASRETSIRDCRYNREQFGLQDKQFACSLSWFSIDWHTSQLVDSFSLTSAQMSNSENFGHWDFAQVWALSENRNSAFPYLRWYYDEIPVDYSEYDFDVTVYHASWIYDVCRDENNLMEHYFYTDTPSKILDTKAKENHLYTGVKEWEELQLLLGSLDDPYKLPDKVFEKKDVYEGIIFSLFEDVSSDRAWKDPVDEVSDLWETIDTTMREVYAINIAEQNNFSQLTAAQKKKLREITQAFYEDKGIGKAAGYVDKFSKAMDWVEDWQEYCEYINNCMNIMNVSDAYKLILLDMYEVCPQENIDLKAALKDCISVMEMSQSQVIEKMVDKAFYAVGENVVQAGMSKVWDGIKESVYASNPYAALLWVSYSMSTYACDTFLHTSDIAERITKIAAMLDIRALLQKSYQNRKLLFSDERVKASAENYLAAIDINFRYLTEDCKAAKDFTEAVPGELSDELLGSIQSYQGYYDDLYHDMMINWLYQLEVDRPEEYANFAYLLNEPQGKIKKYKIACPVDVYIYDEAGQLVASVVNNKPYCKENSPFTVAVSDDTKEIWFYGGIGQYTISYIGTDNGTMDISIEEYDVDTELIRQIKHLSVPLADGIKYTSQENLEFTDNTYVLQEKESKNTIMPNVDTASVNIPKYAISIKNGYMVAGKNSGYQGSYYAGEKVTIYASIPADSVWKGWKADGFNDNFVNKNDRIATFIMPAKDVEITAIYDVSLGGTDGTKTEDPSENNSGESSGGNVAGDAASSGGNVAGDDASSAGTTDLSEDQADLAITAGEEAFDKTKDKLVLAEKLVLKSSTKKIAAGEKLSLSVKFEPDNVSNQSVKWMSSNKKYATVNKNGVVTTKKAGAGKYVIITAMSTDGSGVKATVKLQIMRDAVTKVKISMPKKNLGAGKSIQLAADVLATGKNSNKALKWSCSNTKYATVDQKGKVKAKKAGRGKTVTITAMATDGTGKKASVKLKIK